MTNDPLNDTVASLYNNAAEVIPLAVAPKKWIALKTALSYLKTMSAWIGATFVSLGMASGGGSLPSLSHAPTSPVARPEEHLPGISEDHDAALEAGNVIEAEMVSVFQVSASDSVRVSVEETGDIDTR